MDEVIQKEDILGLTRKNQNFFSLKCVLITPKLVNHKCCIVDYIETYLAAELYLKHDFIFFSDQRHF